MDVQFQFVFASDVLARAPSVGAERYARSTTRSRSASGESHGRSTNIGKVLVPFYF